MEEKGGEDVEGDILGFYSAPSMAECLRRRSLNDGAAEDSDRSKGELLVTLKALRLPNSDYP